MKVLLVEDEALTAMYMQKELKREGFTITRTVSTGENAISTALLEKPDLILMDILLGGDIDGIEAASTIQSSNEIPIIFTSGYDTQALLKRASVIKPHIFLIKPIEITELTSVMKSLLINS
ncbi:MAG: response regulator [Leptospira sp.]|nr:response regulator [Leptospira sp.]